MWALEQTWGNRSDSPVTGKRGKRLGDLRCDCWSFEGQRPRAAECRGREWGQVLSITCLMDAVVLGEDPAGSGGDMRTSTCFSPVRSLCRPGSSLLCLVGRFPPAAVTHLCADLRTRSRARELCVDSTSQAALTQPAFVPPASVTARVRVGLAQRHLAWHQPTHPHTSITLPFTTAPTCVFSAVQRSDF